jgi:hypothetical protein
MKRSLAMFAGLLLLLPAAVLAANDPAGVWEGTLATPQGDIGFVFNLHRDGDKWAAEMDIPSQVLTGLPLNSVKVDGASVSFAMPGPGDPHYDGKLSADGKTISGTFNQGPATLPLDLKWKSEPRAVAKAQPNTGEVQILEGSWEGVLDLNGTPLHIRFHFTKKADGDISGTFDSVEQGGMGLPISSISRTGDTVKLEMKTIGGSFEGTLDKDASTMKGALTQGGANMPLTMERKAAKKS